MGTLHLCVHCRDIFRDYVLSWVPYYSSIQNRASVLNLKKKDPFCLNSTTLGHGLCPVLQHSPILVRGAELQDRIQPVDKSGAVCTKKQKCLHSAQSNSKCCCNVKEHSR